MKEKEPDIIDVDTESLEGIRDRIRKKELRDEDYQFLGALITSYVFVTETLKKGKRSIRRLQKLLFGAKTEKTDAVVGGDSEQGEAAPEDDDEDDPSPAGCDNKPSKRRKGHGRNGADDFPGAETIEVPHQSLKPHDVCPDCQRGKVYDTNRPHKLIRLAGQAPVEAKVYKLQTLRCSICSKVFTATAPKEAGEDKYDITVAAMIGLLRYGSGLPFKRLEGLQGHLGMPLPDATQWDIVDPVATLLERRNSTNGSSGNSTNAGSNPTPAWAKPSPICSSAGRNSPVSYTSPAPHWITIFANER